MFISTSEQRLINSDHVKFFEVLPYLNEDKAMITAVLGEQTITLFTGTAAETKEMYDSLIYALSSDVATFTKMSMSRR